MSTWVHKCRDRRNAVTVRRMRALDQHAMSGLGIPGIVLMENAGRGIAEVALKILGRNKGQVVVLCGKGNNAGDGFVVARYLHARGIPVQIWAFTGPRALTPDARRHFLIARCAGVPVRHFKNSKTIHLGLRRLKHAALVIDAILGTGLRHRPRAPYDEIIRQVNVLAKKILAADIPSGLDADQGKVLGVAVRAFATAACAHPKKGFFRGEGPRCVGRLFVVDIGLPRRG